MTIHKLNCCAPVGFVSVVSAPFVTRKGCTGGGAREVFTLAEVVADAQVVLHDAAKMKLVVVLPVPGSSRCVLSPHPKNSQAMQNSTPRSHPCTPPYLSSLPQQHWPPPLPSSCQNWFFCASVLINSELSSKEAACTCLLHLLRLYFGRT
jgi:hypothetical protein